MKLKHIGAVILVEEMEMEQTTAGGLVIPDTVQGKKVKFSKVLAVGDGVTAPIDSGDTILVPFDANGIPVEDGGGKTFHLIAETNVLAKLTNE